MSDPESSVTRLEKKVDRVLQLLESQIVKKQVGAGTNVDKDTKFQHKTDDDDESFAFIPRPSLSPKKDSYTHLKELGGSSSTGVFTGDETTRTILLSLKNEITQLQHKVETLENRLRDELNASQRQVMSELQKEIKDMMSTATSSHQELQTKVQQQTGTLENIHGVTSHLSNQLNTVVEETKDATSRLDAAVKSIFQGHMGKSATLNMRNVEEIKAHFNDMVRSAETSISVKTASDSRMLKEQIEQTLDLMLGKVASKMLEIRIDTGTLAEGPVKARELLSKEINESTRMLKEQVCRVLDEVKSVSKETEKCTKAISQNAQILSSNALQKIQTSVNVISEHFGQMLEGGATSSAHSQYVQRFDKETAEAIQTWAQVMSDQVAEILKALRFSETALTESIKKSSEETAHGFQTWTALVTEQTNQFLDKVEKSNTALSRNAQKSSKEETALEIQNWATTVANHVDQILQEVKALSTEMKNEVKKSVTKMSEEIHGCSGALNQEMRDNLQESLGKQSQNTLAHVDKKMRESAKNLKDSMYKLKNEIFAYTEKECRIVRDCMQAELPENTNYILDLYVEDFKLLIKSGAVRYSPPWLINQFKSSVRGKVRFLNNGKLDVWMVFCLNPREVGLQPRHCGQLKVNAVVFDTRTEDQLPALGIGEFKWAVSEENVTDNRDTGCKVGEIDCQAVLDGQYADIPTYLKGAVLVRFSVDVLQE